MKKLITILFLLPVLAYGQSYESYAFTKDKQLHTYVASGASALIFTGTYLKTGDAEVAFMVGTLTPIAGAAAWEFLNLITGGEISLADLSYSSLSSAITSGILYGGLKVVKRIVKIKRKKKLTQQQIFELEY